VTDDEKNRAQRYGANYFDLIESEIFDDEKRLLELLESRSSIKENLETLIEKREVLNRASTLIGGRAGADIIFSQPNNIMEEDIGNFKMGNNFLEEGNRVPSESSNSINLISGVIKADDELRMKRMIFRVSRGRAATTFWDLPESPSEESKNQEKKKKEKKKKKEMVIKKKIFAIFFQSGEERVMQLKVLKCCDIFNASRFNIPKPDELGKVLNSLDKDIKEKEKFLHEAENSMNKFLLSKGAGDEKNPNKYQMYRIYFKKEKTIYSTLNKCQIRGQFLYGEVWIPVKHLKLVEDALKDIVKGDEAKLTANLDDVQYDPHVPKPTPPTYIPVNDFLWPFQEIVDTYGVPRYQEINPTYFNIVTFPFLFGVMFGDIGHGFLLLLFGLYLCIGKNSIEKDKTNMFVGFLKVRWLLLLMGFFAFYMGFLYNDFFSIPLPLFGTCYENEGEKAVKQEDCVYPFGMDPKWYVASNELTYFNSFKMKSSVILGVGHMLFGIILRGVNAIYFKDKTDFIYQFIPQFIFMTILFGYMDALIFIKWATNWAGREIEAPSLITTMMNIFLKMGSVPDITYNDPVIGNRTITLNQPTFGGDSGETQSTIQIIILIIAFLCVPIMLFPKPCIEHKKSKNEHKPVVEREPRLSIIEEEKSVS
jgi:V-type H+-transporting ATPase subunit a